MWNCSHACRLWSCPGKIFVLILHVTGDHCQLWVGQEATLQELEIVFRCSNLSMGNYVLYNPDRGVKYSVIDRLRLINSAQLCNKKFQSIHWLPPCLSLMHALAGGVDTDNPMFCSLIKHFCRLKSIWKIDNLPSNAMFTYVLIFSER